MSHTRKLLLCAACANELSKVGDGSLSALKTGFVTTINNDIDVLISGVGTFQTAYHLTRALMECEYKMVLTAGIAGDYDPDRPLHQIFSVERSTFADCGFETADGQYQPIIGSKFLDDDTPQFQSGYIINSKADTLGLTLATANTVSRTCTEPINVKKILCRHPADLETMESAAFSYICAMQHVPYAEIRCTSNHIVPKKEEPWMIKEAVEVLGKAVEEAVKTIRFSES